VLSRLETFANPYDAPSDNSGGGGGRTARVTRDRVLSERSLALRTPSHARTNFPPHTHTHTLPRIRLVVSRAVAAALFTYDVPHYQAQAAAAASENSTAPRNVDEAGRVLHPPPGSEGGHSFRAISSRK